MGFIDLSGALGRHFGSIGVAVNEINTRLTLTGAERLTVAGQSSQRAGRCLQRLCAALGVSDRLALDVVSAIPEHIGLGSGTQMALAIGAALNAFYDLQLSVRDIACLTERGARSGIGIGVFEQGGLVVDGGRGLATQTPPLLVRLPIPEPWRFILVFDRRGQGLHGEPELDAFKKLPPFPQSEAARLCYLLLMQALPAVAEQDIAAFGAVISQLQQAVGEHFAPAQGGIFTSPEVAVAMQRLQSLGAVGIGQTSWGPTGFCLVDSPDAAVDLIDQLQGPSTAQLDFRVVSVRNCGADVRFA